jgi:hypothetical protein
MALRSDELSRVVLRKPGFEFLRRILRQKCGFCGRKLRPKMPGERRIGNRPIIGQHAFSDARSSKKIAQTPRGAFARAPRYRTKNGSQSVEIVRRGAQVDETTDGMESTEVGKV